MDYKRLSSSSFSSASVYMLDVDNTTELNTHIDRPQFGHNNQKTQISRRFTRIPLLNKCTVKWFVIWSLCVLALINSIMPHYQRFIISPFTNPDDTSISIYPTFTYDRKTSKNTDMLIVVTSDADDYEQRELIRTHWANTKNRRSTTKVLFLVGLPQNKENDLERESSMHEDIILTSIREDYYNLPLKTLVMLLFTNKHYPQVDCLVKADSDNYLNVSNLEKLCDSLKGNELITGHCEDKSVVIRSFWSKWKIPSFVYPSDTYPLYCFGETYVFVGRQIREKLLSKLGEYGFDGSRNRRLMPEDVIYSGFLAEMANIKRQNRDGFALQKHNVKFDCLHDQPLAYSFHLINEEKNFAKAIYHMSKTDHTQCTE